MQDSFNSQKELLVEGKPYRYFCLKAAAANGLDNIEKLPFSLKIAALIIQLGHHLIHREQIAFVLAFAVILVLLSKINC